VGYKLERVIGERTLQRPGFILRRHPYNALFMGRQDDGHGFGWIGSTTARRREKKEQRH